MRTVIGIVGCASAIPRSSVNRGFLPGNRRSHRRLIRPRQPLRDEVDEFAITLDSELAGFWLERRLVRGHRQLMLDEGTQGLGDEVELMLKPLVRPAQPIKPNAKSVVEFGGTAAIQPCTEGIRKDCGLR